MPVVVYIGEKLKEIRTKRLLTQEELAKKAGVSAARSDTRGRPPLGFGGSGGSSGAIRAHNASGNSSFAMPPSSMASILLPWLLTRRFC